MRELKIVIMTTIFIFAGCSDDKSTEQKTSSDHVWKEQTQAIDKAKAAQGLIEDATVEQRKIIDEQVQ